jgi:hypothetical protein
MAVEGKISAPALICPLLEEADPRDIRISMQASEQSTSESKTEGIALFVQLPPDVLLRIFCHEGLRVTDVLLFGATSKDAHALVEGSAELWRALFVRDFRDVYVEEAWNPMMEACKGMPAKGLKKMYRQR